jgi:plastocyanin
VWVVKKFLPWMVCALVVGAGGLPALASGRQSAPRLADARVIAFDYGFHEAGQPDQDNVVHIPAGGTVEFSYPQGQNEHNVDFGQDATTCKMTAAPPGEPLEEGPPLPSHGEPPGWAGSCQFNWPGTYQFWCSLHSEMTGTVVVGDGGGAATPTPSPTPTPTPTPTASASLTPVAAATVVAQDNVFQNSPVTVDAGNTVAFAYPSGNSSHNVVFNQAPSSCVQTAGNPIFASAPPLPQYPLGPGWEGYCTFNTPGTYTFYCEAHPTEMTGSVTVRGPSQPTPTPSPSPSPTSTPSPSPTASPTPTPSPSPSFTPSPTASATGGATGTPPAPAALPSSSTPPPAAGAPVRLNPAPKVRTATFKRSTKTFKLAGAIATSATGKVRATLTYKVGKKKRTKVLTLKIARGRFAGKVKLPARDARRAAKLTVTVSYAGNTKFMPATKKATVKVSK